MKKLNPNSTLINRPKEKGQVALFIALIFQVLFVFFAMMVNVGLLVHHKINLQNSVDIAAYYAGMKQAETLNVIAHVNYQIHQAMKLLNFRYRHLGEYGFQDPGFDYPHGTTPTSDLAMQAAPTFCIGYSPFNFVAPDETYCKSAGHPQGWQLPIPSLPSFPTIGLASIIDPTLGGVLARVVATFTALRQNLTTNCLDQSSLNLFVLENFLRTYKKDISMRKRLIISLANNISNPDPVDLDGAPIKNGVSQTILRNLTYQNKAGLKKVVFYNSLSGCGGPSASPYLPPSWLVEKNVYPYFWASMSTCEQTGNQNKFQPIEAHSINDPTPPPEVTRAEGNGDFSGIGNIIKGLAPSVDEVNQPGTEEALYNTSLGFEKNPWCMGYVAVEAESEPQIPFSPFGSVRLTATAYAKPFGAEVGPWFSSTWPSGSPSSNGGTAVDKSNQMQRWTVGQAPPVAPAGTSTSDETIDIPRFVGDGVGTKSVLTAWGIGSAIKDYFRTSATSLNTMSLTWWDHLLDPQDAMEVPGTSGDVLAYDPTDPTYASMRALETAVIAPDNFDVTYYAIEPDFYRNYLQRLTAKGNPPSYLQSMNGRPIRGDIGSRATDNTLKSFSVKDQISTLVSSKFNQYVTSDLSYYAQGFPELLTSFKEWVSDDTSNTWASFGACAQPVRDTSGQNKATSGNCVVGGRTGYSVKLVDGGFLSSGTNMELGGQGQNGPILNPPPNLATWTSAPTQ